MNNKYLYCEECSDYPDLIEETTVVVIKRKWNGSEYKAYESSNTGEEPISICSKCGSPCEIKPQGEEDAKVLSALSGEFGGEEDVFSDDPEHERDIRESEDEATS